jgi:transposase-like protein
MTKQRRQFSSEFKFQVALEAVRNVKTVSQIASEYGVHPTQVGEWKKQLLDEGPHVFAQKANRQAHETAKTESDLYEQIGRLKMELEWLKKKAAGIPGGATRHD